MRRPELNQQSVLAEMALLTSIIQEPEKFKNDIDLQKALKSQGEFSKYKNEQRNIINMSLNTQKSCAEQLLEGGFDELNERRKNAILAFEVSEIAKHNSSNKNTRSGLLKKVEYLEKDVSILEKQNMLLATLIMGLKTDLEYYAHTSGIEALMADCKVKSREIEIKLNYALNGLTG